MKMTGNWMRVLLVGLWLLVAAGAALGQEGPMAVGGFVDELTVAVVGVELAKVDLPAIGGEIMAWMPQEKMTPKELGEMKMAVSAGLAVVGGWKATLETAGVERIYFVFSTADLPYFFAVLDGAAVDEGAVRPLLALLGQQGFRQEVTTARIRGAVVAGAAVTLEHLAKRAAAERPEMRAASAALVGEAAVQAVVIPPAYMFRVTEEMLPVLPVPMPVLPVMHVPAPPAQVLTRGARWAAVSLTLPPEIGLELRVQSDSAAAAEDLNEAIGGVLERLRQEVAQKPGVEDALPLGKLKEMLQPRVEGEGLTLRLGKKDMDVLINEVFRPVIEYQQMRVRKVLCAANLRSIGDAIMIHADDHDGQYPASLVELVETAGVLPTQLTCPESGRAYVYRGAGLTEKALKHRADEMVVAYDAEAVHNSTMVNVLFADRHVAAYEGEKLGELIATDNEIRRSLGLAEKPLE